MMSAERIRFSVRSALVQVWTAAAMLFAMSCSHDSFEPQAIANKTILVYIAGDNNLVGYVDINLEGMCQAMNADLSSGYNLIAFIDRVGRHSSLVNITNGRLDTIKVWSQNLQSSSPDVLSMVINTVVGQFPAQSYGLMFWGHGTGWLPYQVHTRVDPRRLQSAGRQQDVQVLQTQPDVPVPFVDTRASCVDTGNGKYEWMNTSQIAEAIPDGLFDFILFDQCFMSGVEIAYDLRDKADWMIGSAVEIMAEGYPYASVMQSLFYGDYRSACRIFYDYYSAKTGDDCTAAVALIDLGGMNRLAKAFRQVVDSATVDVDNQDMWYSLQRCDRFINHVMFDFLDVAEHLEPGAAAIENLHAALADCVRFCLNTQWVVGSIELKKYCGLNCFLPVSRYDQDINAYFMDSPWNRATGFLKSNDN